LLSAQQAGARAAYTLVSVANTRSMRNSLRAGYEATGLARLRIAHDDAIDWPEVLGTFDRAGYGSACRAWLMTAQRLPGQAPPAGFAPSLGALRMLAKWRPNQIAAAHGGRRILRLSPRDDRPAARRTDRAPAAPCPAAAPERIPALSEVLQGAPGSGRLSLGGVGRRWFSVDPG